MRTQRIFWTLTWRRNHLTVNATPEFPLSPDHYRLFMMRWGYGVTLCINFIWLWLERDMCGMKTSTWCLNVLIHCILDYLSQRILDQGHVWSMINYNEHYIQYFIFVHLIRKQASPYGKKNVKQFLYYFVFLKVSINNVTEFFRPPKETYLKQ